MMTSHRSPFRRRTIAGALILALSSLAPAGTAGQDSLRADTSLGLVPADAAWYSMSLRLGEQWDALAGSRAYQRFLEHPWVALGIAQLRAEWENPDNEELATFRKLLEQPENQELLDLAKRGLREEVFCFGDDSVAELLMFWNRFNRAQQMASFQAALSGQDAESGQRQALLRALSEHSQDLVVPGLVIGIRIPNEGVAERQIERLESSLRDVLAERPQLVERLARETIGGREFLVWRLTGDHLPWKQMAADLSDEEHEWYAKLQEVVREKTAVVAVGIWDRYLVISLGPDTGQLERLGAEPLLVNHERLAPLRDAADRRLASVGYVSNDFLAAINVANLQQFDDMADFAETLIDSGGPLVALPEDLQLELKADIRKLAETIKESQPSTGAILSYTLLVPQGYESFTYNWGEKPGIDPTKPLPILQHTGGNPILAAATRQLYQPEQYESFAWGMRRVGYHIDRLAQIYLSGEKLAWYERFREEGTPLVDRFNTATSDLLLPSLAEGQVAFVLDADVKAPAWHAMMPPSAEPLPLPALGLVFGVSDAEKLKQAGGEYLAIAQDALDRLRTAIEDASESGDLPEDAAEQFPNLALAPPQSREIDAGTLYWYPFPAHWGLSEELAVSAALSEDYVAFALLPQLAERLIEEHPLEAFGLLDDRDRSLAGAVVFDFAGLVEAARPWVGYIVALSQEVEPIEANQHEVVQTLDEQIQSLLNIAACFRGVASVTYREGNVFITHARMRFEDLPAE